MPDKLHVSQAARDAADKIAVRTLINYRRRDGLTSYAYDDNRARDEAYIRASFAEIVAPAFAQFESRIREELIGKLEGLKRRQFGPTGSETAVVLFDEVIATLQEPRT